MLSSRFSSLLALVFVRRYAAGHRRACIYKYIHETRVCVSFLCLVFLHLIPSFSIASAYTYVCVPGDDVVCPPCRARLSLCLSACDCSCFSSCTGCLYICFAKPSTDALVSSAYLPLAFLPAFLDFLLFITFRARFALSHSLALFQSLSLARALPLSLSLSFCLSLSLASSILFCSLYF